MTVLKNLDPEDRNINILNLKMYSLLYSVILNDFDRVNIIFYIVILSRKINR